MRKFVRTRTAPPPASPPPPAASPPPLAAHRALPERPKSHLNGHANGTPGAPRSEEHSTLSRCGAGGGVPWEDGEFPAARALGGRARSLRWMRPHELTPRPYFLGEKRPGDEFGEGEELDDGEDAEIRAARRSVEAVGVGRAGGAGAAAVCGAAAALAPLPSLLARALPRRPFSARYCGALRFRLWRGGAWREVVVDDRLPTRRGRALYSRAADPHDFTLPLLEKAFAKLYGSYRALRESNITRALQELTGGIVQNFSLRDQPNSLTFQVLQAAVARSTLVLAVRGDSPLPHAVVGVAMRGGAYPGGGAEEALVRLRPPLADRHERGDTGHGSRDYWLEFGRWRCGGGGGGGGGGWVSVQLAHVGPDEWVREAGLRARRPWRAVLARRRWRRGFNAGGPPHHETTSANPQFLVQTTSACHAVVCVSRADGGAAGWALYAAPPGCARRPLEHLPGAGPGAGRGAAPGAGPAVVARGPALLVLPAGRHLVVPHARRRDVDEPFLLRIYTDEYADVWELNDDNMIIRDIASEYLEDSQILPAEVREAIAKVMAKGPDEELDARRLRRAAAAAGGGAVGREAGAALVALAAGAPAGGVARGALPAVVARLWAWRGAWAALAPRRDSAPALRLRALLRGAGLSASNKVLEAVVVRYAAGDCIRADRFIDALAKLHLAHERYRALESKLKSNPISLEEMILMTIYS